ncbi:BglG family transcription antiterminator LicT [uncultured Robinsoniella sp.]|uniref:BglG family transcription antiterminator LicT n=1 Tax=uncultured Robinsoniella sp. TaxID=904190 RepID=UPI00374E21A5
MYEITKIINNNIVCSVDEDGQEIIIRGLGIGFKQKPHDTIPDEKIEKVYKMESPKASGKLQELMAEIPLSYVETCTEIIDYARNTVGKRLNENIYITLTDHISFAIERQRQNMEYRNALLMEIRNFYIQEFQIGCKALEIIKEKLNVELSRDEAGFIALHIVNAELNTDMCDMVNITEMMQQVLDIVEHYYQMKLDDHSLAYERFITHLKFFGQRLFSDRITKDDDVTFQKMVKKRYKNDYKCAEEIRTFIRKTYKKEITEEEMIFLTIHLRRVSNTV